jgi:hypothetical protein
MNWRAGVFRLWLLGTAAWMIGWALLVSMSCHLLPDGKLVCRTVSSHWIAEWIDRTTWSYLKIGLVGFSVPAIVLVVGAATVWATSRRL